MNAKNLVYAIVGGIIVALLTGLIPNTPSMLVGAVWYGYPFAWLIRMIVAPQYFPWTVDYMNLIADIVVWAIIVGIILLIWKRAKK